MSSRFGWVAVLLAVVAAVVVGMMSYNAGVAHGLAVGANGAVPYGPYAFGWYRPWGFGFFPPLFFVLVWLLLFRVFFWGGYGRRREWFDEWHRRAHERMKNDHV